MLKFRNVQPLLHDQTTVAITHLFRVPHNRAEAREPLPAIFPGWSAPIVRVAADGERELVSMSWGPEYQPMEGETEWARAAETSAAI